ncbi:hypothetical protein Tco_1337138 [Tanacetum coccineum]
MSSPNHSTSDIEDAFSSMNILNYTSVSSDYFPASSGSISFNSSENSNIIPSVISPFYNNPCLKDVVAVGGGVGVVAVSILTNKHNQSMVAKRETQERNPPLVGGSCCQRTFVLCGDGGVIAGWRRCGCVGGGVGCGGGSGETSILEETDTLLSHSDDSVPDYETFFFNIEEKSSGSTTTHSDFSLLDYEAFYFDDDHIEEKSSGSTTTHSDFSLPEYDSFIFDLLIDPFPPADRSVSHHEEFADELASHHSPRRFLKIMKDRACFTIPSNRLVFDLLRIMESSILIMLCDPKHIDWLRDVAANGGLRLCCLENNQD